MKKASDKLFQLINSLTKQEKRYFKINSGRHKKNYMKLFDAVAKQEKYDEMAIRALFRKEPFIKRLDAVKDYLYEMVLKSLDAYHTENSINARLKKQLHCVEILYKKGLYKQCSELLMRAKKITLSYEKQTELLEILEWERQLLRVTLNIKTIESELYKVFEYEQAAIEKYKNLSEYTHIADKMFLRLRKGERQKKHAFKEYATIIAHPLFKSEKKALSFAAKMHFYRIQTAYYFAVADHKNGYRYAKKLLELFELYPNQTILRQKDYALALFNFLVGQRALRKTAAFFTTLNKIRSMPVKHVNLRADIFIFTNDLEFVMYRDYGQYYKGYLKIPDVEKGLKQFDAQIRKDKRLNLYYSIFLFCFGTEKYNTALTWMNKILNDTNTEIMFTQHCFARITNLILHYEMGNMDLLEYLVKSTYRFLHKRNALHKFETCVLDFIRKKLVMINSQQDLIVAFKELKTDLQEITKNPFEERALVYFDFISWLESKIESRSFAEIVRENAKQ